MFLWGLYIDPLYLVLFFATLIISGAAQLYIRSTFSDWSGVSSSGGLAGEQIGERLVLTAAAMTYVAAAVTSILTLLYYISRARRG